MINRRVVAHRGFTRNEVENTLGALCAAVDLGVSAIEFDVRATADGMWVVHHDADLSRIYGQPHRIADHSLESLTAAAPILTLEMALQIFHSGCRPMIEIKETTTRSFDALATILREVPDLAPLVIVRQGMPEGARALLPGEVQIYLFSECVGEAYASCSEPITGFDLKHDDISHQEIPEVVDRFAAKQRELAVWTVNDADTAELWLEAGVRWVITDTPDILGDLC